MIVWIFREQRSGSTAFADKVAKHLGREHLFVDLSSMEEVTAIENPEDYVFSTHSFDYLKLMESYISEVLLIRCTRHNKVEQWLSYLIAWSFNNRVKVDDRFWNIKRDKALNINQTTFDNAQPVLFTKKDVLECVDYFCDMRESWNRYAKDHNNYTIYYEDLCNSGVTIDPLELYNCKITDLDSYTVMLPSYKRDLCMNYDMVQKWIESYIAQVVEW